MTNISDKFAKDAAIRENIDPEGKKWGISPVKNTSLYAIGEVVEGAPAVVPPKVYPSPKMDGMFTKPEYAQKEIESFLKDAWGNYVPKVERKAN